MAAAPLADLSRLALHTFTTKPWDLEQACAKFAQAGVAGITVWRQHLQPYGPSRGAAILKASGLHVPALCRGGFFPALDVAGRQRAIDDNRRAIDDAAAIGAGMVVLVCGAVPGLPLSEARAQIADGLAAVLPHAQACGVSLAIEPLHPMYAADRSAVSTMTQARQLCDQLAHPRLGIALDVYHVWWDDRLQEEIRLAAGAGRLLAFHVCDWRVETRDLLNDRGLMGEGVIPLRTIRGWVEAAGFTGFNEVEIFSQWRWAEDQDRWLQQIIEAYRQHT